MSFIDKPIQMYKESASKHFTESISTYFTLNEHNDNIKLITPTKLLL